MREQSCAKERGREGKEESHCASFQPKLLQHPPPHPPSVSFKIEMISLFRAIHCVVHRYSGDIYNGPLMTRQDGIQGAWRRKDEQFDGKQMHLAREWKFPSLLRFESCVDCFGPSRFVLRTAIKGKGSLGAGERIISVVAEPLPEQWKIRPLVIINQLNRPRLNYNDGKWRKRRRRKSWLTYWGDFRMMKTSTVIHCAQSVRVGRPGKFNRNPMRWRSGRHNNETLESEIIMGIGFFARRLWPSSSAHFTDLCASLWMKREQKEDLSLIFRPSVNGMKDSVAFTYWQSEVCQQQQQNLSGEDDGQADLSCCECYAEELQIGNWVKLMDLVKIILL